jgi:steroid delta-isomerase-like uncharacterized protein
MNAIEVAQRYLDAWNRHDADTIAAAFAEGSTYHNPNMDQPLSGGQAVGRWAKKVWAAFPDFSRELVSMGEAGGGWVAIQWVIRGTNTGPGLDGRPPTGRTLTLPGATFLQVEGDKIRSEHVYHDRQTIAEQLGATASPSGRPID